MKKQVRHVRNSSNNILDNEDEHQFNVKTKAMNHGRTMSWASKIPVGITLTISIITLLSSIGISIFSNGQLNENRQKIAYVSELKQLTEHIEKNALHAREGNNEAFKELKDSQNNFSQIINILKNGGKLYNNTTISPVEPSLNNQLTKIENEWNGNKPLINNLVSQEISLTTLKASVDKALEQSQNLINASANLQKVIQVQEPKNMVAAQEIFILTNRINQGLNILFAGTMFNQQKGNDLIKDLKMLNVLLSSLKTGASAYNIQPVNDSATINALSTLQQAYVPFSNLADLITPQIEVLNNTKEFTIKFASFSKKAMTVANDLNAKYMQNIDNLNKYSYVVLILFIIGISSLALVCLFFFDKEKKTKNIARELEKSQNNQKAVDLLLEQINPMSKGDFTRRVYVSDKFVTQIAEKVDHTRESFANIVKKIKNTSEMIVENADETDITSKKLLEVSDMQFSQMENSIEKLGQITSEMDEVAQKTWLAQEESNQSKAASQEGKKLVSQSINKMNEIRNNIQESSKKIKKSSESAQAISEVTALIQYITKKIEVLAVNAAIQAASSGEAGREFKIVAQEVKRLAIDSKEATEQILELVKDVQEDINIAVSSMEITTKEVVEGAKLTDNAGQALNKIENLSTNVATRVEEASAKLEEKSSEMTKISLQMKELQATTEKSKAIVRTTAEQMESLKNISIELTATVKGYKIAN